MNKIIKFYLHKAATSYFIYIVLAFLFIVFIVTNLVINDNFKRDNFIINGNNFINTPIYLTSLVPLIAIIIFSLVLAINIYQSNDSWFHSDLIMMTKIKNRNTFIWGRMLSLFILIVISSLLISFLSFIAEFIFHDLSYNGRSETSRSDILFTNNISFWSRIKQMFSTFIFSFSIIVISSLLAIVLTLFFKTIIAFISFIFIVFVFVGISMLATNAYTKRNYYSRLTDSQVERIKKSSEEKFFKSSNGIYQYKTSGRLSKYGIEKWKNDQKKTIIKPYEKVSKIYSRHFDPITGLLELNHLFLSSRYQMSTEKYYGERFLKNIPKLIAPSSKKLPFTSKNLKYYSDNIKTEYSSLVKKISAEKLASMNILLKNILPDRSIPMDYIGFKKLLVDVIASNKLYDGLLLMNAYVKAFGKNKPLSNLNRICFYFINLSDLGPSFQDIYESNNPSSKITFTKMRFLNDVLDDSEGTFKKYKKAYDKYAIPHYFTETYEFMDIKLPTRSWMFIYIPLIFLITTAIIIYEKKRNFS